MAQPPDDDDEYMQRYLQTVDLQKLDLNAIDVEHTRTRRDEPEADTPWIRIAGFIIVAGVLIWFPNSNYYQLHGQGPLTGTWVTWGLGAVALWLGLSTGRWLWNQGLAAQARALRAPNVPLPELPTLPPALVRGLMLVTALGLAAVVLFVLPHDAQWMGNGYSSDWFLGVGAALAVGVLVGRWLIAQASAAPAAPRDIKPIKLPPWFKWANLAMLVCGAMFALFGNVLFSQESESVGFGMSGVGLAVGILGAIWLARRFDEMEARLNARTRERHRL